MVHCNIPCQLTITFVHKSRNDHIIRTGPYSPNPVTAVTFIFWMIVREGWNTVRAVELGSVREVTYEFVEPVFGKHISVQCPISIDTLRGTEAVIGKLIIEKTILFAPHMLIDIVGKISDIIFKFFYFLPTLQVESHFQKYLCYHNLLQAGIKPYHMPVTVDGVISLGDTWHVVHSRSPTTAPVGAITPSTVQFQPFVIGCKYGKDLIKA